jgi:hypothetical protein
MSCDFARLIGDDYICETSGNRCIFVEPDSRLCADLNNEGPEAESDEVN